jgi:hypothetical protein
VTPADRVPGDHRDHRLGEPPDLDLEVEDVEAADPVLVDVAVVPPDPLVAAAGERVGSLSGEDEDPDLGSSRATSNARISSATVSGRNALRTSGRSIVILAMPSAVSYRISVYSPEPTQFGGDVSDVMTAHS